MPTLKRQSTGQPLSLPDNHKFGGGGEGEVYRVPNDPSLVAKVYFPNKLGSKSQKLQAMLANPPADPTKQSTGHTSIAWPVDLLFDAANQVAGYLMPNAQGMDKIFGFYVPTERQARHPGITYLHLLSTARNLSSAVSALHNSGYVIGDVNESNAMAKDNSLVTLIDTDSFQVPDPSGKTHRSEVGKEEFTPPELQGVIFSSVDRRPEHDLFGLGVLIFQLLMEGAHPFDGKYLGAGNPPTIGERIKQGYFPHGQAGSIPFGPKPIAPPFAMLPPAIQQLFLKCFDDGHHNPQARPTALMWRDELKNAISGLTNCGKSRLHRYHKSLTNCPWCERAMKFGVDLFSAVKKKQVKQAAQQTTQSRLPVINYFRAGSNSITAGQKVTLSWDVANVQSVSIVGLGNFAAQGGMSVSPAGDTTYVIEARNGSRLVTGSVAVAVAPPPPVINYFRASGSSITAGQSIALSWDVANAGSVNISGIGAVAAQGSVSVSPTVDTTYVLEGNGGGAVVKRAISITVKPAPVAIAVFQASNNFTHTGAGVTLQWQVNHAQAVEIDNNVGPVPHRGSQVVYPPVDTTYTLTARGLGGSAQSQVRIRVSSSLMSPATLDPPRAPLRNPIKLKR